MTVAVGVCGFGRCGSTMLMRMLDVGGIPPVAGSSDVAYELPQIDAGALVSADLDGRAVKLLDAVLYDIVPERPDGWRFVWLDRTPREQAQSAAKLMRGIGLDIGEDGVRRLAGSYPVDRPKVLAALRRLGEVHVTAYETVLAGPFPAAERLAEFLAPDLSLDVAAAALEVHERGPRCRPDLAFETTGHAP